MSDNHNYSIAPHKASKIFINIRNVTRTGLATFFGRVNNWSETNVNTFFFLHGHSDHSMLQNEVSFFFIDAIQEEGVTRRGFGWSSISDRISTLVCFFKLIDRSRKVGPPPSAAPKAKCTFTPGVVCFSRLVHLHLLLLLRPSTEHLLLLTIPCIYLLHNDEVTDDVTTHVPHTQVD